MANAQIIQLPFPVRGVDRGMPAGQQRELTTRDLLNVRALHVGDRVGGGMRAGVVKAFAEQLPARITCLHLLRLNRRQVELVDGVGPACFPEIWRNLEDGVDARGRAIRGFDPPTMAHIVGDFGRAGPFDDAERYGQFNMLTGEWSAPIPAFDESESSVDTLIWDDGTGPALYVAGMRNTVTGLGWVSRWDGSTWANIGFESANGSAFALAVHDDGSGEKLYVGGDFTSIGAVSANRIARWDGSTWEPVGSGFNGAVLALEVFSGELYAGGTFTGAPNRLAVWDGSTWEAVETATVNGVTDTVLALRTWNDRLYIGGRFRSLGGGSAVDDQGNSVFRHKLITSWDGTVFYPLVAGLEYRDVTDAAEGAVRVLSLINDGAGIALWAGGHFQRASAAAGPGIAVPNLAKWNGENWSAPRYGFEAAVDDLRSIGTEQTGRIFAVGNFEVRNAQAVNGLAAYTPAAGSVPADWRAYGGAGLRGMVKSSALSGTRSMLAAQLVNDTVERLYVGLTRKLGWDDQYGFGPDAVSGQGIAAWNGSTWQSIGALSSTGERVARSMVAHDDGSGLKLYVGGYFSAAGGVNSEGLARFTGSEWESIGELSGPGIGEAAASIGMTLYVGGAFSSAGGVSAAHIAAWNGSAWSALGSGVNDRVFAIAASGSDVIVGGMFTTAGGGAALRVAKWNGSTWAAMADGFDGTVYALAVFSDELYAAGSFAASGATTCSGIAKWNGAAWEAVGDPEGVAGGSWAKVLRVFDGKLWVGGDFTSAGGLTARCLATWDGTTWARADTSELAGFYGPASGESEVQALAEFAGELIAGGSFWYLGGQTCYFSARADGDCPLEPEGDVPPDGGGPIGEDAVFFAALQYDETVRWITATEGIDDFGDPAFPTDGDDDGDDGGGGGGGGSWGSHDDTVQPHDVGFYL